MRMLWGVVVAAFALSAMLMTPLAAGVFCNGLCAGPCQSCRPAPMPCNSCHLNPCGCAPAPAPIPVTQTIMQQRTVMQPQQVMVPQTTYRDVVRTEFRTQPELQSVPVTRYRQVTVDEGQWQQVWVPRPVTKSVPETVMEQRTTYRSVPYQVTERVPQTVMTAQTQMVPRIVSEPVQVRSACSPCGTGVPAIGSIYAPPLASVPAYPSYSPISSTYGGSTYGSPAYGAPIGAIPSASPVTLGRELQPLSSASNSTHDELNPVPDPRHLDTPRSTHNDWSSVPTRSSSREPVRTSSSSSGLFVPARASRVR